MKDFTLTKEYLGYQSKKDITNADPRYLAMGSQNVLINAGEKIVSRDGISLYGQAGTVGESIIGSYDWNTSTGVERNLRCRDDKIQYAYTTGGVTTWRDLATGFSAVRWGFGEWWSATELIDFLLIVNGDSSIRMWTGAITTFASATANTITKQGTNTWAQDRFLKSGTRQVTINGTVYTYTGGEATTTLTGVTPDPTAAGHAVGSVVMQTLVTTASKPGASYPNDMIVVHKNQAYIGSATQRTVYVSKNTDYTDFAFSATRVPGEGAFLTLDGAVSGLTTQEDAVYISVGRDNWFQTQFTVSSDNTKENLTIVKLKSGPQQAAKNHNLIWKIKNSVVYVSNEPTFDTLGRVENISTPQSKPISDPIDSEFIEYDFTNAHGIYWRNQSYITLPAESLVLIYDHENQYWQPPQTIQVSRLAIINGLLYGHASSIDETYRLFDPEVQSDLDNPITSIAAFTYNNYGNRTWQKRFDEYFWEGYATLATQLFATYKYDFGGSTQYISDKLIDLTNPRIQFYTATDGSLGKFSLGKNPIGSVTDSVTDLPKFRTIHTLNKSAFYEMSVLLYSNEVGFKWELLAHGPNAMLSTADNVAIKT